MTPLYKAARKELKKSKNKMLVFSHCYENGETYRKKPATFSAALKYTKRLKSNLKYSCGRFVIQF